MLETAREGTHTELRGQSRDARHDAVESLGRALDGWRGIDGVLVQLDLASLELRDELHADIDAAEHAYLTARLRVSEAREDADTNVANLRKGVERLLEDVRSAVESAERAVRERVVR